MSEIKKWDEVNGTDDSGQRMEAFLDSVTDSYAILQLRHSDETLYERFSSMRELGRMGITPDIDHYEVVYVGELTKQGDQIDVLEGMFTKFNIDRPEDFKGHSLSVSDIVALKVGGVVSCHYVDSIGFAELPRTKQHQKARSPSSCCPVPPQIRTAPTKQPLLLPSDCTQPAKAVLSIPLLQSLFCFS